MSSAKAAVNSFDECNVFEKAAQLSVILYGNKLNNSSDEAFSINTVCNCRSLYDKFVYFNRPSTRGISVRDRKPSRIPKKRITYFEEIQECIRRLLRTYIRKSIPKSPRMHLFTNKAREKIYAHGIRCENKGTTKYPSSAVRRKYRKSNKYRILKMQNQYPHVINSPKPKQLNAWRSNLVPNVYKNLNHKVNNFKSNLSRDIETNPGPVINSTKIIQAPYSQDDVAMFRLSAGTQCVAMSLASSYITRGMVLYPQWIMNNNIMNIGNDLYSGLSSLSWQSYLLLTEVPEMIIVFNIIFPKGLDISRQVKNLKKATTLLSL